MAGPRRINDLVERLGPAFVIGLLQGFLGLLLLWHYRPDADGADSTVRLITNSPLASVRSLHSWLATALVALVLLHLAFAWVRGPSEMRAPRPWLARVALVAIMLFAFLSGTILKWDQGGWETYEHLRAGLGLPSGQPGDAPLSVVFALHVLGVPLLLGALVWRRPEWRQAFDRWSPRWRDDAMSALGPLVLLGILAWVARPPLGPSPIPGVALTRPEWPFLWLDPLQDALGPWGLLLGTAVVAGAAVAAPWIAGSWTARRRTVALWLGAGVLLALSVMGFRS